MSISSAFLVGGQVLLAGWHGCRDAGREAEAVHMGGCLFVCLFLSGVLMGLYQYSFLLNSKKSHLTCCFIQRHQPQCFVLVIVFINFKQSVVLHRSELQKAHLHTFFFVIISYIHLDWKKEQVILCSFPV